MNLKTSADDEGILLKSAEIGGTQYFFLPSGVTEENMEPAFGDDASYETMQSANIASLHFFSSDPDKLIDYVHDNKGESAPGTVYMYDQDFNQIYSGKVDGLKGRGNTTWFFTDKKSYQIKLAKKADLLDPANGDQKAKKWVLLANPYDPGLWKNYMAYDLAKEIGLECSTEGRPVDFYYDGVYRGTYYLCEKVEIGDSRIEIDELEKEVEKANPDVDFDALEEVTGENSYGNMVKYEDGITDPEDITGGYLIELDHVFFPDEKSWFRYYRLAVGVVKSPEYTSATMMDYISCHMSDMFKYVNDANRGLNDASKLGDYIDLDSFARYFLVSEWLANNDVWTSSTFVYKPKGDDVIYAGPVWDFDSSMRVREEVRDWDKWYAETENQLLGGQLFGIPAFRQKLQEVYKAEMRPVIFDILLGDQTGEYLKPASVLKDELAASCAMNYMIWDINDCLGSYYLEDTVEANYAEDFEWLRNRAKWFDEHIMSDGFVSINADVTRIYGDTRFETSLEVADAYKEKLGYETFDSVILAYGRNYADALAGSYLSCMADAPILLVDDRQDHIDAVQAYIKENLTPSGTIYMLGGEAVVSDKTVAGLDGYQKVRLGGKNRYETNLAILKEAAQYADEGAGTEILVASGLGFADSLSAAAAGRPILLVKNALTDEQKEYLASLEGDKKIYIIGGTGAVSDAMMNEVKAYGETERIDGSNRYETSVNVARKFFDKPTKFVLAYGQDFPDGLCGGALAYAMGGPLVLTADGKTANAAKYASACHINTAAVLGGPALISSIAIEEIFAANK
ncbi:MAG: cell wall-binding repeat-containing protein [Eubacterium sp.]|nr:cell wall-binding repeat-containing protein [Eubacterium sp.]